MSLNICLFEPEIPYNTGAIARSCGLTKSRLHLIHPLGFSTDDKHLKRAGLDYWPLVDITHYKNFADFEERNKGARIFLATTKTDRRYCDVHFKDEDFIVFGKETAGLPEYIHDKYKASEIHIPMLADFGRSLNLANAANVIMFEALKQLNFPYMK